jgi:hypothetical protein
MQAGPPHFTRGSNSSQHTHLTTRPDIMVKILQMDACNGFRDDYAVGLAHQLSTRVPKHSQNWRVKPGRNQSRKPGTENPFTRTLTCRVHAGNATKIRKRRTDSH